MPASSDSSPTFNPTLQRSRMTKSKATSSTTAIQPLEITTTAVVMSDAMRKNTDTCPADLLPLPGTEECTKKKGDPHREYGWKQSIHHHTHHHSIKSPNNGERLKTRHPIVDLPTSPKVSPLNCSGIVTPLTSNTEPVFSKLPPPALKTTSDAMTALQDAAKVTKKKKNTLPFTNTSNSLAELFDSSFFSAVLLVQWSNVVGPKTEKIWSAEGMDERLEKTIGRQILNGEMGRNLGQDEVEAKWVVLHRQAIVCTGFLYNDQIVGSLCGLVLVVPTRYLRNFSQYFGVLQERVPIQLVKPLVKLRKAYKRHPGMTWLTALDYFTWRRLIPFVRSIMNLESVSLPTECIKVDHEGSLQGMLKDHHRSAIQYLIMNHGKCSILPLLQKSLLHISRPEDPRY
ncbi:hypothetical protein CLU79DRAFT_318369 [Phycomyces nitens]|nr:hypothetical protein CLU79DRAFT_318369 [Phycomyces nitens]